jgi:hypothetical protein
VGLRGRTCLRKKLRSVRSKPGLLINGAIPGQECGSLIEARYQRGCSTTEEDNSEEAAGVSQIVIRMAKVKR